MPHRKKGIANTDGCSQLVILLKAHSIRPRKLGVSASPRKLGISTGCLLSTLRMLDQSFFSSYFHFHPLAALALQAHMHLVITGAPLSYLGGGGGNRRR